MPRSVPNYLTVDPTTGAIGAVFPGGVQIPEGSGSSPPKSQAVSWLQQSDGAVVAQISDYDNGVGFKRAFWTMNPPLTGGLGGGVYRGQLLTAINTNPFDGWQTALNVQFDESNAANTGLFAIASPPSPGARPTTRTIFDARGASDYLMLRDSIMFNVAGPFDGTADRSFTPDYSQYFAIFQAGFYGSTSGAAACGLYMNGGFTGIQSYQFINIANVHQTGRISTGLVNPVAGVVNSFQPRNLSIALSDNNDAAFLWLIPAVIPPSRIIN